MSDDDKLTMPDGQVLAAESAETIAEAFALALVPEGKGDAVDIVMTYLHNRTVGQVLGPAATDAELRQHEGRRELYGWIMTLIQRGQVVKRKRGRATHDDQD